MARWFGARVLGPAVALAACTQTVVVPGPDAAPALDAGGAGQGASGTGGGPPDGGSAPESPDARARLDARPSSCQSLTDGYKLELPAVIIAIERSMSMLSRMGDSTRQQVVAGAVLDVVRAYEGSIEFGLDQFPATGGVCSLANGCCAAVTVGPRRGGSARIAQNLHCETPGTCGDGDPSPAAPIGEALRASRSYYDAVNAGRAPRYVLLIADGDPSCPSLSAANACESATTQAVVLASQEDVRTLVLGVGEDARSAACLDGIAVAGGEARSGSPRFWSAERPEDVTQALRDVAQRIADEPCRLRLPVRMPEGGLLEIGKLSLARDPAHSDGWDWDGDQRDRVIVSGPACGVLKSTVDRLAVSLCFR